MEFMDPSPAEVLKFGSPRSWHREDVNGICGPLLRIYNLRVNVLGIGRM